MGWFFRSSFFFFLLLFYVSCYLLSISFPWLQCHFCLLFWNFQFSSSFFLFLEIPNIYIFFFATAFCWFLSASFPFSLFQNTFYLDLSVHLRSHSLPSLLSSVYVFAPWFSPGFLENLFSFIFLGD